MRRPSSSWRLRLASKARELHTFDMKSRDRFFGPYAKSFALAKREATRLGIENKRLGRFN